MIPLLIVCFLVTLLDIVVVEGYYRPRQLWSQIKFYHWFILLPLVTITFFLLLIFGNICNGIIYLIFISFGLEDTLFYVLNPNFGLKGQFPEKYWGVTILSIKEPSLKTMVIINTIGLILIVIVIILI